MAIFITSDNCKILKIHWYACICIPFGTQTTSTSEMTTRQGASKILYFALHLFTCKNFGQRTDWITTRKLQRLIRSCFTLSTAQFVTIKLYYNFTLRQNNTQIQHGGRCLTHCACAVNYRHQSDDEIINLRHQYVLCWQQGALGMLTAEAKVTRQSVRRKKSMLFHIDILFCHFCG